MPPVMADCIALCSVQSSKIIDYDNDVSKVCTA